MSDTTAREFVEGLAAEVHRKVWLQMLLYGEVRQCAGCGYIFDGPADVHECAGEP